MTAIKKPGRRKPQQDYYERSDELRDVRANHLTVGVEFGAGWKDDRKMRLRRGEPAKPRARITLTVRCCKAMHKVTVVARGPVILHGHTKQQVRALRALIAMGQDTDAADHGDYGCLKLLKELDESVWQKRAELKWFEFMRDRARGERRALKSRRTPYRAGDEILGNGYITQHSRYYYRSLGVAEQVRQDLYAWRRDLAPIMDTRIGCSRPTRPGPDRDSSGVMNLPIGRALWRARMPGVIADALFLWPIGKDSGAFARIINRSVVVWKARIITDGKHHVLRWDWPLVKWLDLPEPETPKEKTK